MTFKYAVITSPKEIQKRKCYQATKQKTTVNKDILHLQENKRAYYRAYSKARYSNDPEMKKAASMARYRADPDKKKVAARASYRADPEKKKAVSKANYMANPEKKKALSKANYRTNPEKKKAVSEANYRAPPEKKKAVSKANYRADPEKKKAVSKANYRADPEKKKAVSKANYRADPEKKKAAFRRYAINTGSRRAFKRHSYALAQPKLPFRYVYMKKIQDQLLNDCEATAELLKAFKKQHATVVKTMPRLMARSAAVIATKRLINKALSLRIQCAGSLLRVTRQVQSQDIAGKNGFR